MEAAGGFTFFNGLAFGVLFFTRRDAETYLHCAVFQAALKRHLGNARRKDLHWQDDQGKPLWVITKERHDSPQKIDDAMAGCLSWEARTDAVAAGVLNEAVMDRGVVDLAEYL